MKNNNEICKLKELANYVSCIGVCYGNIQNSYFEYTGYQSNVALENGDFINRNGLPVNEKSIFDLSSVSKFFTIIVVLKTIEQGYLSFDDTIDKLDERFINLKEISIGDLLSYQVELRTSRRIEECSSIEEIESLLFNCTYLKNIGVYSDIPAMVVRIIVEKVMNKDFYLLIKEWILIPASMNNTYIKIPEDKLTDTVSNNYEIRIIDNSLIIDSNIERGICNDPKARVFAGEKFAGHAGIFSTIEDMNKLCRSFLDGKLLSEKYINMIGENKTGKLLDNGKYRKYLGYLSYSKHPVRMDSEVHPLLSDHTIAFGGYTGNQLTIDPINNVYLFMAANRCHYSVTQIIPASSIKEYICDNENYVIYNNKKYKYTKNFIYLRDDYVINPIINFLISQSTTKND